MKKRVFKNFILGPKHLVFDNVSPSDGHYRILHITKDLMSAQVYIFHLHKPYFMFYKLQLFIFSYSRFVGCSISLSGLSKSEAYYLNVCQSLRRR